MQKVLVAGASGSLGFEILRKLKHKEVYVKALVRSEESIEKVSPYATEVVLADAGSSNDLYDLFKGIDIVCSAVGQSVSLFKKGGSFEEIDYGINKNLIESAVKAGVSRFVYISIKGSDSASNYELAEVHKKVEDLPLTEKINQTVIRPVGFFSGFIDWLIMGKQGIIPVPGEGAHKTNPIHPEDLAQVVIDNLFEGPQLIEAGGPEIFTRLEIAKMIAEKTNAKIIHVPKIMVEPGLFFLKFIDGDAQTKLDYFNYVSTNDMIAPQFGNLSLRDYVKEFDLNQLPDAWPV